MSGNKSEDLKRIQTYLYMFEDGSLSEDDCIEQINQVVNPKWGNVKRSRKWDSLKGMPNLYHKLPDMEYSAENSEVLQWISQQPGVMEWLLNSAHKHELIEFDSDLRQWRGVDYNDD